MGASGNRILLSGVGRRIILGRHSVIRKVDNGNRLQRPDNEGGSRLLFQGLCPGINLGMTVSRSLGGREFGRGILRPLGGGVGRVVKEG